MPVFSDRRPDSLSQLDLARQINQALEQGAHVINISGGQLAQANEAYPALLLEKNNGLTLKDIAVLSIGTGNTTCPYSYEEIKGWSSLGWVQRLPDIFLNPASQNSEDIGNQILDSVGSDILRLDFDLNDRLQVEKQPGRLRSLLEKPHNRYIFKKYQKYQKIGEEIDNPENCQELIEAAKCFLDCGEVYDQKPGVPVRDAIPQFIKLH